MQALTATVFPCYAEADRDAAAAIASFLERGADVRVFLDEGALAPGQDLVLVARPAAGELAEREGLGGVEEALGELISRAGIRAGATAGSGADGP